jgi:tetratricopeptide (TPR) repeat protein
MPVLYTRLQGGLIYGEAEPVVIRPPELRRLNRGLLAAIVGVALLVIAVGIFLAVQNVRTQETLKATPTPSEMTKGFNVAIAEFSVVDEQGQPLNGKDGLVMADYLYDRLLGELAAAPDLDEELWPASLTGPILGDVPQARRSAAAARAEQIHAHVLIFGQVRVVDGIGSFIPEFYVSYQGFARNAPEILESNLLGDELEVTIPFQREQAAGGGNPALVARSRALGLLTIGLGYYAFDRYEQALSYFDQAVNTPDWLDSAGKEIAYLMRGNARVRLVGQEQQRLDLTTEQFQALQTDLIPAQADYQKAWEITGGAYGRALIGLGGVAYLQAFRDPNAWSPETVDETLLKQAEDFFNQALNLPDQPVEYHLPAKAHFSLGQVYQVRGEAFGQEELFDLAKAEYQQVIEEYKAGADSLQEMASQSYARLGYLEIVRGSIEGAVNQYEAALEIASPYYQAVYSDALGRLYFEYGVQAVEAGDETNARPRLQRAEKLLEEALKRAQANTDQVLVDQYQALLTALSEEYGQYLEK